MKQTLYQALQNTVGQFEATFNAIPADRKKILLELTRFIESKQAANEATDLIFICTHNSRRSHISQLWAQAAAAYYGIKSVACYSGGTEATAFNPRAVKAMSEVGFQINKPDDSLNPHYEVRYSDLHSAVIAFSKVYDDAFNPQKDFAAIMTCSHADENCPLVPGASARIALTYDDPKDFDGTPLEAVKYIERVNEIGREIFFAFSQVNA
jgi:arsenate reductase (thioredoxin)